MSNKKKFKETKVGKFLNQIGSTIGSGLDDVLPDSGVLGVVKRLIEKDETIPQPDKETALKMLEMDLVEMQEVTKRWQSDMSATGTWLTKNVRPLTLVFFSVCVCNGVVFGIPCLIQSKGFCHLLLAHILEVVALKKSWETTVTNKKKFKFKFRIFVKNLRNHGK